MKALALLLTVLGGMLFVGCSSSPKAPPKADPGKINWSERIGSYAYEQALSELGKPAVTGESNEGRFGEWLLRHSSRVSFGFGVGAGSFGSHGGVGVGVGSTVSPPPSGEYLRLQFGPDGQLKAWSKVAY